MEIRSESSEMYLTRKHTLWRIKVHDLSVGFEHVNLFDHGDGLDVELLQSGLNLLVIRTTGRLIDLLDLATGSSLSSDTC